MPAAPPPPPSSLSYIQENLLAEPALATLAPAGGDIFGYTAVKAHLRSPLAAAAATPQSKEPETVALPTAGNQTFDPLLSHGNVFPNTLTPAQMHDTVEISIRNSVRSNPVTPVRFPCLGAHVPTWAS